MGKKCNSYQWWNSNKWLCVCKKRHVYEKDYILDPATFSCQNVKYLEIIMDDSSSWMTKEQILIKKFLLTFFLTTIALLIAVSIYYCLIKYRAKWKHLLPFHNTNNELVELIYW